MRKETDGSGTNEKVSKTYKPVVVKAVRWNSQNEEY